MIRFRLLAATAATVALSAAAAFAGDRAAPTVVELFTSQGCYSCPPAERFLAELAGREDVLALEFHVDYWDDLVYGAAGRWKDPFSRRAHTVRQTVYNERIRGRSGVYTPQMVIDGRFETVGSRRAAVMDRVDEAVRTRDGRLRVEVTLDGGQPASVRLAGGGGAGDVWLVRFLQEKRTDVSAGENKGKSLLSRHIVTGMRRIGRWEGRAVRLPVSGAGLADGEGCAVLVQADGQGPVLGAAPCPAPLG